MGSVHREHPEKTTEEANEIGRYECALVEGKIWCPTCKTGFKVEPHGTTREEMPLDNYADLVKRVVRDRACPSCGDHNLEVDTRARR